MSVNLFAQNRKDTAAIVKELRQVMSFTNRNNISYETETRINSVPVLSDDDVAVINGKFIKNGKRLYYRSGDDELLVVDSLLFQINHKRKSIWILRLTKKQQEEMEGNVTGAKEILGEIENNYTLQKELAGSQQVKISFFSKNYDKVGKSTKTTIQYDRRQMLPEFLQMDVTMKEETDNEMVATLMADGIDTTGLVIKAGDRSILIRKQSITVSLKNWSTDGSQNINMPSPFDYVRRDFDTDEPLAIGIYADYEVRKLF